MGYVAMVSDLFLLERFDLKKKTLKSLDLKLFINIEMCTTYKQKAKFKINRH